MLLVPYWESMELVVMTIGLFLLVSLLFEYYFCL